MLKHLLPIVIKEVKELVRDPKILLGMIIVPLILFPLMGFAIQTSMETITGQQQKVTMAVINHDKGPIAENLLNFLITLNVTVTDVSEKTVSEAAIYVQQS
ncbi:unnamed protein product, partial [marine sediment metagenome]